MVDGNEVLASLSSIPPFPAVATEVLQTLKDPSASMNRIVGLVQKDVGLTTAVLKLANSGLYARREPTTSTGIAFNVLGAEAFGQAINRAAFQRFVGRTIPVADMNRCWAHSIACSEISKMLAESVGLPTDDAASAGLLHDLGRFGLGIAAPAEHSAFMKGKGYDNILEAEREVFGIDHTVVGGILAKRFHLPAEIHIVAGRHHEFPSTDKVDILSIVSVACSIASCLGYNVCNAANPRTLAEIIEAAPRSLRSHIFPEPGYWTAAIVNALGSSS